MIVAAGRLEGNSAGQSCGRDSRHLQVGLDRGELVELLDQEALPPDPGVLFDRLAKACSDISGFQVAKRVILGNFSYAKLPIVLDLETATDTLAASDLICAIAGDEKARAAVRARHPRMAPNQPDTVPPADEFLVLDADASQSYAINCAVGGADLVIEGGWHGSAGGGA